MIKDLQEDLSLSHLGKKEIKNKMDQGKQAINIYLSHITIRELKCFLFFLAEIIFLISLSIPKNTIAAEREVWLWIRLFLCFQR